jgi:hypothetical protein
MIVILSSIPEVLQCRNHTTNRLFNDKSNIGYFWAIKVNS